MADYYTLFSFTLELPSAEAVEYALNLFTTAEALRWESDDDRKTREAELPRELVAFLDGWSFQADKQETAIWIHSDDGGVDAACQFVQHLLDRFGITEPVSFEWANTCSRPCLDSYGGGAVVITPNKVKVITTCEWVFKQVQRIRKRTPKLCESGT